jgi:hypothetical protein
VAIRAVRPLIEREARKADDLVRISGVARKIAPSGSAMATSSKKCNLTFTTACFEPALADFGGFRESMDGNRTSSEVKQPKGCQATL